MANNCKFQKKQYQVSYDSGTTWENVMPVQFEKGDLLEYDSPDCTGIDVNYRWRVLEGQYICDGNNKYTKEMREESYDNGITWYTSYPTVYRQGEFVGVDTEFCCEKFIGHYIYSGGEEHVCPFQHKWNGYKCVYIDPLKVVKCDGDNTLTSVNTRYYTDNYTLLSGEIGNSVISIAPLTFARYTSLTSITIPSSVTSIGSNAFYGCTRLTSINIPSGVTSISNDAFINCINLTSMTVDANNSTYDSRNNCNAIINTSTNTLLSGCKNTVIPDGVTSIANSAFTNCSGLTSVVIPSGVTSIGNQAFSGCTSLTSVTINATTPPTLGFSVFENTNNCPIYVPCESLLYYRTASEWTAYFNRIQGIPPCSEPSTGGTKFYATYNDNTTYSAECVSVGELTTATTKSNGHDYSGMTSAEIGNCVTTIGQYAFRDCINLSSCTLGYYVSSISNAVFYNCSGITSIEIPSGVRSIGWGVFASCTNITNIVLPSNISSIGDKAFSGCTRLTSVTVNATTPPSLGWSTTSSEGPLSDAFSDCPCTIYVPCGSINAYRTDEVWSYYASRIVGIPPCSEPAPTGSTKLITTYESGAKHYVYCNSSSTITSNEKTTRGFGMTMIDAEIGDCVTSISNYAFSGCTSLRSVTIPDSVTIIYQEAFRICTSLSSVTIPDSVTSIGSSAFRECSGLTSVTIGSGVTSIGGSAFSNCSGLTSIEIPSGVTSIGGWVFSNCTSLTNITVDRTTPPTLGGYGAFNNTNNCPIYVPSASVETYKSARYWSDFADRIQAIPT